MNLRKKKTVVHDIWDYTEENAGAKKKHPSQKRTKKTPLPHPGQSYNPDPVEHTKLLQKIAKKEIAYQKKQANINKAVDKKVNLRELRQHEHEELVSGIKHIIKEQIPENRSKVVDSKAYDSDSGSSTDSAYSDYDDKDFETIVKDKTVVEKRKSKKQRLAQLKDKMQRKAAKLRKLTNIRLSKIDAIKKITKELDKREKELASKKHKHRKIKNERLGSKFEQSDPIYCLSNELPSNLRQVSCPMDAIVREQMESFQSRLLVEPTKFQTKKRKYKKRQFERKAAEEE